MYQKQMDELIHKTPFHCIITGPTNCGKTEYLVSKLRGSFRHVFEYIILICPTYIHNKTYRGFAQGDKRFFVFFPNNDEEIQEILKDSKTVFSGTNTLIILDDCAVTKEIKKRSNELIRLAFSGRHEGFSVWVLTQQLTSISKPFRDNIACIIAFHNPSQVGTKTMFEDHCNGIPPEARGVITNELKTNEYSRLCISQRHPFDWYLELPCPDSTLRKR